MYQVVDKTGQVHGPVPLDTLRNWASEGRLTTDMTVINQTNGQQGPAGQVLAGSDVFATAAAQQYAQPAVQQPPQQAYTQPQQPSAAQQFMSANVAQGNFAQPQQQFGFQGSTAAGSMPKIGPRGTAFLVDFLLATGAYGAVVTWADLLLSRYEHGWIASPVYYVGPWLIVAYLLFKDCLFPGQSVGKRIAHLKVINAMGGNCTVVQSILRNILILPLVLVPIPYAGPYAFMPLTIIGALVEIFMVLTTGKRFGDTLAKTLVVNE